MLSAQKNKNTLEGEKALFEDCQNYVGSFFAVRGGSLLACKREWNASSEETAVRIRLTVHQARGN